MITTYQPIVERPRKKLRLPQGNKSNRLMRRYYAGLRTSKLMPEAQP